MSAVSRQGISPVAAHCLRVVTGWLRVVRRGKGGEVRNGVPYTRLKASEVREQLEREEGVGVSTKTVQRALTELVEAGRLTRRQLYKHRYNRTYWYAPSEQEQQAERHRPSAVARRHRATTAKAVSEPPPQKGATERSAVSLHVLSAHIPYSNPEERSKPQNQQPETEQGAEGSPEVPEQAITRAWGKRGPTPATHAIGALTGRLQKAQEHLVEVVARATTYRGFAPNQQASTPTTSTPLRFRAQTAQESGFLR
jgi:hypothetical protein